MFDVSNFQFCTNPERKSKSLVSLIWSIVLQYIWPERREKSKGSRLLRGRSEKSTKTDAVETDPSCPCYV